MKNKLLIVGAALCGLSFQCLAQGVVLSNQFGCHNLNDQKARQALIDNLRSYAPEDLARQAADKAALQALNQGKCQALSGQFALIQEVEGIRQVDGTAGQFWVIE